MLDGIGFYSFNCDLLFHRLLYICLHISIFVLTALLVLPGVKSYFSSPVLVLLFSMKYILMRVCAL